MTNLVCGERGRLFVYVSVLQVGDKFCFQYLFSFQFLCNVNERSHTMLMKDQSAPSREAQSSFRKDQKSHCVAERFF